MGDTSERAGALHGVAKTLRPSLSHVSQNRRDMGHPTFNVLQASLKLRFFVACGKSCQGVAGEFWEQVVDFMGQIF
jgi:hypothetical protein